MCFRCWHWTKATGATVDNSWWWLRQRIANLCRILAHILQCLWSRQVVSISCRLHYWRCKSWGPVNSGLLTVSKFCLYHDKSFLHLLQFCQYCKSHCKLQSHHASFTILTIHTRTCARTHNHLTAICPGLPGRAGTRRNIHPLISILIINRPLPTSSIYYDP